MYEWWMKQIYKKRALMATSDPTGSNYYVHSLVGCQTAQSMREPQRRQWSGQKMDTNLPENIYHT